MLRYNGDFVVNGINLTPYLTNIAIGYNKIWGSDTGRNTLSGKYTGTLIGIFLSDKSDDEVMFYYNARNIYIKQESDKRVMYTEKEKIYFNLLSKYFYFKRFILELFENPKIKNIIESNFDYYNKFLMNNIDQLWANYFS